MVIDRFRFTKKTLSDKPIGLYFAETTENIDADNFICLRCIAKRPHKDTTKTPNPNNMNTISLRLYPETEKLYKRLLDECDSGTNGRPATADQFINTLLEAFQNPKKVEVSKASDLQALQEAQAQNTALTDQVQSLQYANVQLEAENRKLQANENSVCVDLEPADLFFLDALIKAATERYRTDITRNMYIRALIRGLYENSSISTSVTFRDTYIKAKRKELNTPDGYEPSTTY